mmetsp:Transcript_48652/g.95377  ORF Transcript_48652/g.95377 Transcript_48652/m.95377 type:complete len:292 (-) Transcript_48652:69-944(-)
MGFSFIILVMMMIHDGKGQDVSMCRNTKGWRITFEDDFEGNQLNSSNWHVMNNYTHGKREKQNYVTDEVTVKDGTLILTTRSRSTISPTGQQYNYTSGWVDTQHKRFQKFGRFEVRAKLPSTVPGMREGKWPYAWPAHWLMPEPTTSQPPNVCWPVGGEIDIVEGYHPHGKDSQNPLSQSIFQTFHWAAECNKDQYDGGSGHFPQFNKTLPLIDWTQYHTFSVEWNTTSIHWFVDTVLVHTRIAGVPASLKIPQDPFYMILNTAMNPWSSDPLPSPLTHVIDRVTWCEAHT